MAAFLHAANAAAPPAACASADALAALPGPRAAGVPAALLRKEAAYSAAAVGAYELHDHVDFSSWLRAALLPELGSAAGGAAPPASAPLRRAAARALGAWTPRVEAGDRPAVYAALLAALGDADAAVRLAAAAALRALVDDFGFDAAQFAPCAGGVMQALASMLVTSDELDTQTQAFGLINLLIERLGSEVRPFCDAILSLLPGVWQAAEGQGLLRIQVLAALQLLLNVLGDGSPAAYPLLGPLLRQSLDPSAADAAGGDHAGSGGGGGGGFGSSGGGAGGELLEDGLALWLVALRNAPAPHPALAEPFPLLVRAMAASTEHIRVGLQILTSLVLLGGAGFLRQAGGDVAALLANYVGAVNERGTLLLLPPLDLLLALFPGDAPALLAPALARLLALVVLGGGEPDGVVANALGVVARLLLANPAAFQQLVASVAAGAAGVPVPAAAAAAGGGVEGVIGALAALWVDKMDAVAQPLARKLHALALCALLALPSKAQLAQLPGIVGHVTTVWHEVEASGDDGADGTLYCSPIYCALRGGGGYGDDDFGGGGGWGGEAVAMSEEAAGEARRREAAAEAEPLRRLKVAAFLRDRLAAAAAAHGGDLQAALAGLGEGLAQQLQTVLTAAEQQAQAQQAQAQAQQ